MKSLEVLSVGGREQAAAAQILRRFPDQDLTLTDALGLHIMESADTGACWSTDRHLGLTGIPLVIHEI